MTENAASLTFVDMNEDQAVIGKIMGGNVDAFEGLLRKYSTKVFSMVGRKVPREDVETVAQDVFLSAFRSLGTYEAIQPFENWLARIARRRCCDYWRDRQRRNAVESGSMDDLDCQWVEKALSGVSRDRQEQEAVRQDTADVLQRALARLDAEDRTLMESVYFEDVPLKEVAATLEWSLVKTKVRAHRARKKLRLIIEALFRNEVQR